MRWIYLLIVILFVAAILVFIAQNLEMATMSFLGFNLRMPLAVLAAIVYVLGALTGSSLYALIRKSISATRSSFAATP